VEHFLSAVAGMAIDNLEVEINGSEMPHVDGSALPFVAALKKAEFAEQNAPKKVISITRPVSLTIDDSSIVALPAPSGLTISCTLLYDSPFVGSQNLTVRVTEDEYEKGIAPARTFCLASEVQALLDQGLGKGANYSNTLVVGENGPLENTLRFHDEYVRHKMLDILGDLYLLGAFLRARVVAVKSGHTLNMRFVKKLLKVVAGRERKAAGQETILDVREIQKILPHRYPFLLIDKVIEMDGYQKAVGIKNVTANEPFFQGHFPAQPIMPGVLQIEAMAQLAGVLLLRKAENASKLAVLLSLDKVRLRKTVVPGDQLRIEANALKVKHRTGLVYTKASVDGKPVAEAYMKFMLVDE
jgi:UDP-3-O-[3-hydroxymyristoyl] N-acetylglucosamine deacetylase/3-hydroxyacyl-[acyl-carrier-protein] dehydratase